MWMHFDEVVVGAGSMGLMVVTLVPNKRQFLNFSHATQLLGSMGYDVRVLNFRLPFRQQLEIIAETDVYVTSVGTSSTSTFLLSDGAAVVSVGTHEIAGGQTFGYIEEPLLRALYYTRVLYASREDTGDTQRIVELVAQAAKEVREGFSIPVDHRENSSPIGLAIEHYAAADTSMLDAVLGDRCIMAPCSGRCWMRIERYICPTAQARRCAQINDTLLAEAHRSAGLVCEDRPEMPL
eukprot:m51a1_g577 hypothetical protein (237) ;mRNA; r:547824-548687